MFKIILTLYNGNLNLIIQIRYKKNLMYNALQLKRNEHWQ